MLHDLRSHVGGPIRLAEAAGAGSLPAHIFTGSRGLSCEPSTGRPLTGTGDLLTQATQSSNSPA